MALKNVRRPRTTAGRWGLLHPGRGAQDPEIESCGWTARGRNRIRLLDAAAPLWRRLSRLLERESTVPRWRELLGIFRRLEARGTVRGGRFIMGSAGNNSLCPKPSSRSAPCAGSMARWPVTVSAADPSNLVGLVAPGERTAALPGRTVTFLGGKLHEPELSAAAG